MQWGSFDKEQQTATHTHTHWTSFRSHGKWRINYPSLASIAFPSSEIFDKWHCETFLWFFRSQFWSHDLMPLSFLSYALNYPNRISHGKWFCFTEKVNRKTYVELYVPVCTVFIQCCWCCLYLPFTISQLLTFTHQHQLWSLEVVSIEVKHPQFHKGTQLGSKTWGGLWPLEM